MCRKVSCSSCGKATWAGCGMHVSMALSGTQEKDRCSNWKGGSSRPCPGVGNSTAVTQNATTP
eukprot:scaffold17034_cov33-Attheya_sp.AAC.1